MASFGNVLGITSRYGTTIQTRQAETREHNEKKDKLTNTNISITVSSIVSVSKIHDKHFSFMAMRNITWHKIPKASVIV